MAQEQSLLTSDHSIMSDLFELTFRVEELAGEYNLKIPALSLSTTNDIRKRLNRLPKSEVVITLLDSVDLYESIAKSFKRVNYAY